MLLPLLPQLPHLCTLVIMQLAGFPMSTFFSSSVYSSFQTCTSHAMGMEHLVEYQLNVSKFCDLQTWCLHQQGLTVKFWNLTNKLSVACNIWKIYVTLLASNPKRSIPIQALCFLFVKLWYLIVLCLSLWGKSILNNFIYAYFGKFLQVSFQFEMSLGLVSFLTFPLLTCLYTTHPNIMLSVK